MSKPPFDVTLEENWGRPFYWVLEDHIRAIEGLIRADEIEMAFKLLEMVPAYYREPGRYPKELTRIKKILCENMYDAYSYAHDEEEAGYTREEAESQFLTGYTFPRAEILLELVKGLNSKNEIPWVCELSTSHGLLPLGLLKHGARFNFFAKNLNQAALEKVKGWLTDIWRPDPGPSQKTIFVFTEALEHAWFEKDLMHAYYKLGVDFDYILLSVPLGCLYGGLPNYESRRLGHVRGYTPNEFIDVASRFFPDRKWRLIKAPSMVLVGEKP